MVLGSSPVVRGGASARSELVRHGVVHRGRRSHEGRCDPGAGESEIPWLRTSQACAARSERPSNRARPGRSARAVRPPVNTRSQPGNDVDGSAKQPRWRRPDRCSSLLLSDKLGHAPDRHRHACSVLKGVARPRDDPSFGTVDGAGWRSLVAVSNRRGARWPEDEGPRPDAPTRDACVLAHPEEATAADVLGDAALV
jgi:hypothetical protein